jgi:hypothetical protein
MGSGAVIYVPSFIKIGSGVQKLIRWRDRHTHEQQRDLISLLYFFQNKERMLKSTRVGSPPMAYHSAKFRGNRSAESKDTEYGNHVSSLSFYKIKCKLSSKHIVFLAQADCVLQGPNFPSFIKEKQAVVFMAEV